MKPILFNTEMVRAILDGRKTVTRRAVKPAPTGDDEPEELFITRPGYWNTFGDDNVYRQPYRAGDILYVREAWTAVPDGSYVYKASVECPDAWKGTWHPSIHMPKEAARLFLRVTDVRVEWLQDITDAGAIAEGIYQVAQDVFINGGCWTYEQNPAIGHVWSDGPKECFRWGLWDSTIKPADLPLYGWDANPWVWVIDFEIVGKEVAMAGEDGAPNNTGRNDQ